MRVYKKTLLLVLIIAVAAVFRLYQLDRIPSGFIPEEVSNGWNAYNLLKTGRDEWGVRLPLVFRETGGYKLALNSYLIVPVMALFGINEFSVRLPAAVAGIMSVYLTYLVSKLLFKNESYALSSAMLLAVSVWHVSIGRYGVDVNWGVPLFLSGLIFLIKSEHKPRLFLVSSVAFTLTYYTYFNYIVFTVLFLVGVFIIRRKQIAVMGRNYIVIFLLIQFIALLPYVTQPTLFIRFSQATYVSQIGFTNRTNEHRQACQESFSPLVCRLVYNKITDKGIEFTKNYLNHFSTTTFFLYGSKLGLSGMPDQWGLFYPFEFGLWIVGAVVMVKKKLFGPLVALWLFLWAVPSSLAAEGHIWRMVTLLPLPQLIGGIGLVEMVQWRKNIGYRAAMVAIGVFFITRFVMDYTSYLPFSQGNYSYYGYRNLYAYLKTVEKDYPMIIIAPSSMGFDQNYIYYVFYMHYDPSVYQQAIDVERQIGQGGWVAVKRIGTWHFVSDIKEIAGTLPDKTLLVVDGAYSEATLVAGDRFTSRLVYTIPFANGDTAFKVIELLKPPSF